MKKFTFHKIVIVLLSIVIAFEIIYLGYMVIKPKFRINNFKYSIDYQYNEKYRNKPGKVCFGNFFSCNAATYDVSGKVNTKKLGKYKIKYNYKYKEEKITLLQVVNVVDTKKPKIVLEQETINVCPNGKIDDFKIKVTDNYDGDISDKITKKFDKNNKLVIITATDSNKNKNIIKIPASIEDTKAPVLTLNGLTDKYLNVGDKYTDEGVSVKDNCDDDIKAVIKDEVDYNKPGEYNITYSAVDSSNNEGVIQRKIHIKNKDANSRVIYLTFDDGPSEHTSYLLDVLKKYNVKATFFVTGNGSDDIIKREFDEGHKIALHTNSHNYDLVYSSVDNYYDDLNKIQDRVKRITGKETKLIRFPGGSSNTVSSSCDGGIHIMSILTSDVESKGYHYFDWNVSSGDAGGASTADQVYYNVINSLKDSYSIVLQHDTKRFSIDAVERIINYANENGYTFQTLDESSPTAHHGVNN